MTASAPAARVGVLGGHGGGGQGRGGGVEWRAGRGRGGVEGRGVGGRGEPEARDGVRLALLPMPAGGRAAVAVCGPTSQRPLPPCSLCLAAAPAGTGDRPARRSPILWSCACFQDPSLTPPAPELAALLLFSK